MRPGKKSQGANRFLDLNLNTICCFFLSSTKEKSKEEENNGLQC